MSQIRVEMTDSRERHCFRVVFKTRLNPNSPADHEVEILLHATSLVELIHSASTALCKWQHETSGYLLERLTGVQERKEDDGPAAMEINYAEFSLGREEP